MNELELYGAHRAPVDDASIQDAVRVLPVRGLPRHRARRRQWKPPHADLAPKTELQPIQAQHAYDRHSLVR